MCCFSCAVSWYLIRFFILLFFPLFCIIPTFFALPPQGPRQPHSPNLRSRSHFISRPGRLQIFSLAWRLLGIPDCLSFYHQGSVDGLISYRRIHCISGYLDTNRRAWPGILTTHSFDTRITFQPAKQKQKIHRILPQWQLHYKLCPCQYGPSLSLRMPLYTCRLCSHPGLQHFAYYGEYLDQQPRTRTTGGFFFLLFVFLFCWTNTFFSTPTKGCIDTLDSLSTATATGLTSLNQSQASHPTHQMMLRL